MRNSGLQHTRGAATQSNTGAEPANANLPISCQPIPQTSSATHSNVTVSPWRLPGEHSGSLSNVKQRADEPSESVSSSHSP